MAEQFAAENASKLIALQKKYGAKRFTQILDQLKACVIAELSSQLAVSKFLGAIQFTDNEQIERQHVIDALVAGVTVQDNGTWLWANFNKYEHDVIDVSM